MEFIIPRANFILKTSDISASNIINDYPLSNAKGSVNSTRTSITWNAVCIKNILGELYENFELFNLQLVSVGYGVGTTLYGATDDDRNIHYGITGFDWVFTNYNTVTANTSREAFVSGTKFAGQGVAHNNPYYEQPLYTFRKCITTDITINLYAVNSPQAPVVMNIGTIYPQLTFNFIVTPVS